MESKNKCIFKLKLPLFIKVGVAFLFLAIFQLQATVGYAPKGGAHSVDAVSQNPGLQITGTVMDVKKEPLIGVNIMVKGTTNGIISNLEGGFTLQAKVGDVLVVSYVGYTSQEITVKDNRPMQIVLVEDQVTLGEVVVTALGIKKEMKSLTYNVQEIKAAEIVGVKDANFMNSLAGKIAGVTINTSSAGLGGSAKVVMRGSKSVTNNNNALYVIDGIPMPALSSVDQPGDMFTGMGQSGDGIAALNPDDIESMSVLSGAAAAALYGFEAANGVVMITTKKGQKEGFSVSVSNSTTFSSPFVLPEFQNTYGSEVGNYSSWGEKLATPTDYDPADFFQTGYNVTNSVSLSTGTEKSQTYLSLSNVSARGIIHNNDLDRYNVSFRNSTSFLDGKLNLDLGFMFMRVEEQNMLAQGQYFNPLVPIYLFPRGDDIAKYQTFERYNPSRNFKTQYWPYGDLGMQMQNPYWITERDMFNNNKNRYMITGGLKYDIADWINISGRVKYDGSNSVNEKKYSASTAGLFASDAGAYYKAENDLTQLYGDVMLSVNKYINDFSVTATVGASIKDVVYHYSTLGGNLAGVPNMFNYTNLNMSAARVKQNSYHDQTQAVFATAQLGYKSMVYLDGSFRCDWPSAMAGTGKIAIPYPSVGVSGILTEMLPIKSDVLSFLKARFSYSEVGNAPTRFLTTLTYPVVDGLPQTMTVNANENFEPERTKSFEAGLNAQLWGNKIKLDVTFYKSSTYNQLFKPALSQSSGFSSVYINAGQVDNRGIELSLGLNQDLGPVKWNSNLVYSLNQNKIVTLLPETVLSNGETVRLDRLDMGGTDGYKMILEEGGSMGDIYVNTLKVDEHGYIIVDLISQSVTTNPDHFIKAGNANPKYTLGWRNNFEWKGLNLGFLINARIGGVGVSATQAVMDAYGVSKASAEARDNGGALVNGERIPAKSYYETVGGGGGSGIGSLYVYSATNVRLAEVTLGYNFPVDKWCHWIKGLNASLIGRNLLMIYNKAPFDPESTASTGTYFQGIDYFMQPSLRNIGFSLKVDF